MSLPGICLVSSLPNGVFGAAGTMHREIEFLPAERYADHRSNHIDLGFENNCRVPTKFLARLDRKNDL